MNAIIYLGGIKKKKNGLLPGGHTVNPRWNSILHFIKIINHTDCTTKTSTVNAKWFTAWQVFSITFTTFLKLLTYSIAIWWLSKATIPPTELHLNVFPQCVTMCHNGQEDVMSVWMQWLTAAAVLLPLVTAGQVPFPLSYHLGAAQMLGLIIIALPPHSAPTVDFLIFVSFFKEKKK